MQIFGRTLLPVLLLTLAAAVQAQFTFTTNNGTIAVTGYTGASPAVIIPSTINGLPVTSVGDWAFANASVTSVTIGTNVTRIGTNAFAGCYSLTNVTIPNSITSIPNRAFYNCWDLIGVTIPNGVTNIGERAFFDCVSLTNVMLGNNVVCIGDYAFSYCQSLSRITLPDSVTSIGSEAFGGCTHLTSVTIPFSVTNIGDNAFYSCTSLTAITTDTNNTAFRSEDGVLFNKSQTTLIQYPGAKAGSYMIPNGVTSIESEAFAYCGRLTWVTIPISLSGIGDRSFSPCIKLAAITVDAANSNYSSEDGVLFDKNRTTLIQYPGAKAGAYTIPNGVTSVGSYSFYSCSSLTSVTIPNGVTNIGSYAFYYCTSLTTVLIPSSVTSIGSSSFYWCTSLPTLTIPNGVANIGSYAFYSCSSLTSVTIGTTVTSIGSYAFSGCRSLTGVYFNGNAPSIGSSVLASDNNAIVYYLLGTTGWGTTFGGCPTVLWSPQVPYTFTTNNSTITITKYIGPGGAVIIPDRISDLPVTCIGTNAFANCTTLAYVTIPDSVTDIGGAAFSGCTNLTAITVDTNNSVYCSLDGVLFNTGQTTLIAYPGGKAGAYAIPASVMGIGDRAFTYCRNLTSVIIPDSVTSIGDYAFEYSVRLTNVMVGNNVVSIGNYALGFCQNLSSFMLPDSVTSIGDRAFFNCTHLASLIIPESVTRIGDYAFGNCVSLPAITVNTNNPVYCSLDGVLFNASQTTLIMFPGGKAGAYAIPGSVTRIGGGAFDNCRNLTSVIIPDSVTSIGDYTFELCVSLSGVTLPNSVTSIGDWAFGSCTSLSSVAIPNSVTNIGSDAFWHCTSLISASVGSGVNDIGADAFYSCSNLTAVYFEGNAPSSSPDVFSDDSAATVYYLPDTTGWGATFGGRPTVPWNPHAQFTFTNNNGTITITGYSGTNAAVTIPATISGLRVTSIGDYAFEHCDSLSSVMIPSSVINIGHNAFSFCGSLAHVTIPASVTSIGDYAFENCTSLISATIGSGVTDIGADAFYYCSSLTAVYFQGSAPSFNSGVFSDDNTATVYYLPDTTGWGVTFGGRPTAVNPQAQFTFTINNDVVTITGYTGTNAVMTIPDMINSLPVTSIEDNAFKDCYSLTSVTISTNVTSIGTEAFYECYSLTRVIIPNSVTSIGDEAFAMCSSLTNVKIATNVTRIGWGAFLDCVGLTSIIIPSSVTIIGHGAFADCERLTSIIIPSSVTTIGDGAFCYCWSLTSVTIGISVTNIGSQPFQQCTSLTAITVDTNNPAYSSVAGVLFDKSQTRLIQCSGGKAGGYTIPNSVISIADGAFYQCSSLTSVTIPYSVTNIGKVAFNYCYSLTAITVDALNSFYSSLNGVLFDKNQTTLIQCPGGKAGSCSIPTSVASIGGGAFVGCHHLMAITVDTSNPSYSDVAGVLFDKRQTTLVQYPEGKAGGYTIPSSVISIADGAFYECSSLTSVTIPNSVTNIADRAFYRCTGLTGVYFQGNAPSLGDSYVFYGDDKATLYYLPGTAGWTSSFGGRPAVLWNPQVQTNAATFGVRTNRFGFAITGTARIPIVVEASTNPAGASWTSLQICTITNASIYFSDPGWTNYRARYYRLRSP